MTITIPSVAMANGWLAFVRTTFAGGTLELYDGDIGDTSNLLCAITLPTPAFEEPSGGFMLKAGSWTGTGTAAAGSGGTIATWALLDDDDGRTVAIPGSMFGSPLVIEDGDVTITALRATVVGLPSAWQSLQEAAIAASADGLFDPDNPNTWVLRADGGDSLYRDVEDAIGSFPKFEQLTAAAQFKQVALANGRLVMEGTGATDGRSMRSALELSHPFTIMAWVRSTTTADTRYVTSATDGAGSGGSASGFVRHTSGNRGVFNGTSQAFGSATTNGELWTCRFDGASSYQRVNGVEIATGNAGTRSINGLVWGAHPEQNQQFWSGYLGPLIIWNSGIAPPTALEDLIMDLYPIGAL